MSLKAKDVSYEVIRSRRTTADIVIERDGRVLVRAPEWINDAQLSDIVESKYYWIYKALAEWRDLNATRIVREFKNGEGFLYLGRGYRLLFVDSQTEPVTLSNGRFSLRRDVIDKGEASVRNAFQAFYCKKGLERIGKRIAYFAPKIGVKPIGLDVRELGNRWASCSVVGKLSFHWKCMMAPLAVVDYIVVHELCHLHYRDHTSAFWNEVDKVMPAYGERKAWLRQNGAGLDL